MAGINRAEILRDKDITEETQPQALLEEYVRFLNKYNCKGVCVFISHKSEDKLRAKHIGDALNKLGIDVYLDMFDDGLQRATAIGDNKQIVWHIQKAISVSTHMLILLSKDTARSWWVPYEIGYAQKSNRDIASYLLTQGLERPDYLQIVEKIDNATELTDYAQKLAVVNKHKNWQALLG